MEPRRGGYQRREGERREESEESEEGEVSETIPPIVIARRIVNEFAPLMREAVEEYAAAMTKDEREELWRCLRSELGHLSVKIFGIREVTP